MVGQVTFETVIYSVNYDLYTLVQSKFEFDATGNLDSKLLLKSIRLQSYKSVTFILLWVFFVLFSTFYLVAFVKACIKLHRELNPVNEVDLI
jgi:Polycystin cation channel